MNWTSYDTWIALTAMVTAMACALVGNFLVLRRLSMMGDAISHTVLPGLAIAFIVTGTRELLPMMTGALVVGLLTAALVQYLSKQGDMDEGSAMGVVFTSLFAVGLLLIKQGADRVDLDPSCVLYGSIELVPLDIHPLFGFDVPRAAIAGGAMLLANMLVVALFYKELKLSAFDPGFANSIGIPSGAMHYLLMTMVAATCVAAFESVGSILVIAMLIVPAACAHLLTDRLSRMMALSLLVAGVAAWGGHAAAIVVPAWFGFESTSTAGMMAAVAGGVFFLIFLFSPTRGVLAQLIRRWRLSLHITRVDVLGHLYRRAEAAGGGLTPVLPAEIGLSSLATPGVRLLSLRREVILDAGRITLTERGRRQAARLIRTHRLWESYLADRAMPPTKVHLSAEALGYYTNPEIESRLEAKAGHRQTDPHDKVIPPAE